MVGIAFPANSSFIETTNRFVPFLYADQVRSSRRLLQNIVSNEKFPIKWKSILIMIYVFLALDFVAVGVLVLERKFTKNLSRK